MNSTYSFHSLVVRVRDIKDFALNNILYLKFSAPRPLRWHWCA